LIQTRVDRSLKADAVDTATAGRVVDHFSAAKTDISLIEIGIGIGIGIGMDNGSDHHGDDSAPDSDSDLDEAAKGRLRCSPLRKHLQFAYR
jgi:hypothetical protein